MKRLVNLCLLAGLSLPVMATTSEIDRIAAIVNDDIITTQQLETQLETISKQLRAQNTQLPPMDILRRQVLEREIIKEIQLQLAKNTGIIVDDNALNTTIGNIAQQNKLSLRQLRDVLEKDGYDFAQYRENIRQEMIIARLQQREVHSRINISDGEIDSFLHTQSLQGGLDEEYLLSHILVTIPEAASPAQIAQARKKAEEVLARLKKGDDFAQMAVSYSDGQKALEGGSLGWRKAGELPTLFAEVVTQLKPNQIGEIIRSPSGFHIIKLMDKRRGEKHIITQTLARHVLIRTNELVSNMEAQERLKHLRERIQNGDDFAELARSHSDDPGSASKGGSLGWVDPGVMVPEFEEVMNKTALGKISEPFQSQFGWHILQVQERRNQDNSDAFRRNQARDFLRQRKIEDNLDTWIRQRRDEAYVEYKTER
ncbi:MAG: peptidylprolyl isomerase [Gammaproteobacteria bacterium]|nr:peptidylprolyl isomerase [Gammaproteobacteria bacterium]